MFGYLGIHSNYSLLRGTSKVSALIEKSKEMGADSMALVDSHNMYGAIDFYKKALAANIKPILGVTLHIVHSGVKHYYSVILLAKSKSGYEELMTIVTLARTSCEIDSHITFEQLKENSKDVIVIPSPFNNPMQEALSVKNVRLAQEMLKMYKAAFGDNLFVGITPQDGTPKNSSQTHSITEELISISRECDVLIIPMPIIYLIKESEADAYEVLLSIQKPRLSNLEEDVFENQLIFLDRKYLEDWCENICPESLKNLSNLIENININLELGSWVFPTPPIEKNEDPKVLFQKYIEEGYSYRNLEKTKEIEDRVKMEYEVISSRGYIDYFLTVIDLVKFMQSKRILTATRGSAAGCMISYLCGITNVDPIKYKLPFERFLNPFRPSPPDVDLDIADNRRAEVIEYISNRYGKEKVSQIGTLGTMMARAAVRDTARALGYSYVAGDRIAKLIPLGAQGAPMYIDIAIKDIKELDDLYKNNSDARHIIDVAKKIEGNPRHVSIHAAGVVISPSVITKYTPLEKDPKLEGGKLITQYNMHSLEDVGLLKFDILGLTNLSILSDAIDIIKKDYDKNIDIEQISVDDSTTYKMISEGYTIGVFQLGGAGMTNILKKMKPENINDVAAVIALYRPGPIKNIDEYISRKQGNSEIKYLHPKMKTYLDVSYGVLVYQDDLLYTALNLAGYDWEEVDVFRKAVGKKIPELFTQQEKLFKSRIKELQGFSDAKANELWNLFLPFKGYGFNKAHAMSYAKISYLTAYIKCHYTAQYMTAHLSACAGDIVTISELVYESKRMGVSILPPNINCSSKFFTTEKHKDKKYDIRIGLSTIKQVGDSVSESIVEERKKNGDFKSIEDFLIRISSYSTLNRRGLEALIKVGVFDEFGTRSAFLENIDLLLECVKESKLNLNQVGLFDIKPSVTLNIGEAKYTFPKMQLFYWEKELLGVYVSGHPLDMFKKEGLALKDIKKKQKAKIKVMTTAVISGIKPFRNKKGEKMLFLKLEDDENIQIEAVCFPKETEEYQELLALYRPIKIKAQTSIRNEEVTLRVDVIEDPFALEKN